MQREENMFRVPLCWMCVHCKIHYTYYPRRARSALGVDIVLTLDVCMFVCLSVC